MDRSQIIADRTADMIAQEHASAMGRYRSKSPMHYEKRAFDDMGAIRQ